MDPKELKQILEEHAKWAKDPNTGRRADLQNANLQKANLQGADLWWSGLQGANLQGANLQKADLQWSGLQGANLQGANLQGVDLKGAYLRGANLRGADLRGADLRGAGLYEADLAGAKLPDFQLPEGELTVYKKLRYGTICTLSIPVEAKRTACLTSNKCRAEYAVVLEGEGESDHTSDFYYRVGETVRPDSYDPDIRVPCTHGIHFFRTRQEAVDYDWS